jgi:hypothetical protein
LCNRGFDVFTGFKVVDEDAEVAQDLPKSPGLFTPKKYKFAVIPKKRHLGVSKVKSGIVNVLYVDDSLMVFLVDLEKYVLVGVYHLFDWLVVLSLISPSRSFSGSMPTGCYLCMVWGIGYWVLGIGEACSE